MTEHLEPLVESTIFYGGIDTFSGGIRYFYWWNDLLVMVESSIFVVESL